jgi:hypothetical protein
MIRLLQSQWRRPTPQPAELASRNCNFSRVAIGCALAAALVAGAASAQVITIDTNTGRVNNPSGTAAATVDRRFQQIKPTNVPLSKAELDAKTRLMLIRLLQSEQGFAMRPFPRGHKGLTLEANGKLQPAGEGYLNMVTTEGLSAKPGDRLVLTDIKFEHSRIVFDLNGGPDPKHRFLRHVEVGTGPDLGPVIQDNGQDPVGARLSLTFQGHVPELTGADVKALLSPLISFDQKTPIQAFTDTLPTTLKEAILNHHVLVGMSTDMVLFARGAPDSKSREVDGQMPFEEWIYGKPPKEVDFVRINGNRVVRVEIAKTGETPVVFTKDVVEGLMRTDGTALEADGRKIQMGDVERNPDTQAPATPPSIRNPGEKLPDDANTGVMKPVQFPKPKPTDSNGAQTDGTQPAQPSGQAAPSSSQAAPATGSAAPASGQPPAAAQPPPTDGSQPAPVKSQPLLESGSRQPS